MKEVTTWEEFAEFLNNLKEDEYYKVITKNLEGNISEYTFKKTDFNGTTIILYDNPVYDVGIIQDSMFIPKEDFVEGVFENLQDNGECKVFV